MMNDLKKFYRKGLKKILAVISLLCLILSFGTGAASAEGTAKVTVSSSSVERGSSASVSFNLEGNPGIWGLKLRISYAHSAMTLKSVNAGSVFESGELTLSENLNKDPYVVVAASNSLQNKTANGTIVTLNFTVNGDAAFNAYPVTVEVSQANNVDGEKINITSANGNVSVVNCTHANKEWRVTKAANCEETGKETLTCKKCSESFDTRTISATGHKHTEVQNSVAATETKEGYTGDTYCKDCGKLLGKGKTIEKLQSGITVTNPPANNPSIDNPQVYNPPVDNPTTTDSNQTKPSATKKPDKKTASANPTATEIPATATPDATVSEEAVDVTTSGTSVVEPEKTASPVKKTEKPIENNSTEKENKSSAAPVVVVIIVVLIAGGATAFFVIKKRRG